MWHGPVDAGNVKVCLGRLKRVRENLEERIEEGDSYTNRSVKVEDIEKRAMERDL